MLNGILTLIMHSLDEDDVGRIANQEVSQEVAALAWLQASFCRNDAWNKLKP